MIDSIDVAWGYVDNMDRAVAFYENVLGLQKGYVSPHWSDFAVGQSRVGLHMKDEEVTRSSNWMLGLQTSNLKALSKKIIESGVEVHGYHETPTGVLLEFKDTEGNTLQVIEKGSKIEDFA